MYLVVGINPEHLEVKQLSWSTAKPDLRGHTLGKRIMEWLSDYQMVILVEQEEGLSPSIRRFQRKSTWELV